jgi:hypothetical protein
MGLKQVLAENAGDVALLVGNGINLYDEAAGCSGWPDLLGALAKKHLSQQTHIPAGISLPEFYDVLDLAAGKERRPGTLQQEFCDFMSGWCPAGQHYRIVDWAQRHEVPLMTTNFDDLLTQAGRLTQFSLFKPSQTTKAPTDYYPWETYFAPSALRDSCSGFGVWQLHGMRHYRRSIRLGLSHYMGSVERARRWLYQRKQTRMLGGGGLENWRGKDTWLQVFLSKPLLIFGLALQENEVFIRWLLIERARLFSKYPQYKRPAWYVSCEADRSADNVGKLFFLKSMGVEPIRVATYDEIYGASAWD